MARMGRSWVSSTSRRRFGWPRSTTSTWSMSLPQAKPPVCRIMDYGKYRYEQSKREKEARKRQKIIQVKEIRFSPSIEEHDLQTKLRNVKRFLQSGDKVKLTIRFRGREITHQALGRAILNRMAEEVKDLGEVERHPRLEGRQMIMILTPKQQS